MKKSSPPSLTLNQLLVLSCGLSILLTIARTIATGDKYFFFLLWNLVLAAVPLFLSRLLFKFEQQKPPVVFLIMLAWLAFFPNAPYLITDFLHLRFRTNAPVWFDSLLLFSFAWNGLWLGLLSLINISRWLKGRVSEFTKNILISTVFVLTGFGVYLGRYLRWNSWDVILHPVEIIAESLAVFTGTELVSASLFTLFFAVFVGLAYLTLAAALPQKNTKNATKYL